MKYALITDTHFGARNDSLIFANFFRRFYEEVFFPTLVERKVDGVIHLGDIVDRRKFINYKTLNTMREIFLGPDRAAQISPARSAENRQLIYTIHDDAPVVSADPFRTLWIAVARLTSSGEKLGAEEAITRQQALKALTLNSAYQHYIETDKGSIEVGKRADMIILDKNPLTVPEAALRHIKVLETVKDGETVYTLER